MVPSTTRAFSKLLGDPILQNVIWKYRRDVAKGIGKCKTHAPADCAKTGKREKMSSHSSDKETLVPEWAILGGNDVCVIPPDLRLLRDQYIVQITGEGFWKWRKLETRGRIQGSFLVQKGEFSPSWKMWPGPHYTNKDVREGSCRGGVCGTSQRCQRKISSWKGINGAESEWFAKKLRSRRRTRILFLWTNWRWKENWGYWTTSGIKGKKFKTWVKDRPAENWVF